MAVTSSIFGHLPDGRPVDRYVIEGAGGLCAAVLTYGCTLQALTFHDKDVVLGYDTLEGYLGGGAYQGATVGRYANRIADGRFTLDGKTYTVACNESGRGHLHGGVVGFDKRLWTARILGDGDPGVRMSLIAEDGEEGYPGRLTVSVTIRVTADNILRLGYEASSDKDTVLSLTNHAYYNLNGWDGGDMLDTRLTVYADAMTPVDDKLIPTGEVIPVEGTVFDFRKGKAIGEAVEADDPQIQLCGCLDHNFVLGDGRRWRRAVHAVSPRSGIAVDCYTDLPGVQIYTAGGLHEATGKGGVQLYRYQGFCMETQFFPDSPNHPAFPSAVLRAGDAFRSETAYAFSMEPFC